MPNETHRLDYYHRDPNRAQPPTDWIGSHPGIAIIVLLSIVYLICRAVVWAYP